MNIKKPPLAFERELYKKMFYQFGSLLLPRTVKTYFDSHCSEFQDLSNENRFLELGFVLLRGYNVKKELLDWVADRPHISEDSIKFSIAQLLLAFDDLNGAEIMDKCDDLSLAEYFDFFKTKLLNCYWEDPVKGTQSFDDCGDFDIFPKPLFNGHYLGEVHENGKWQWTEYKLDKYDWRAIK